MTELANLQADVDLTPFNTLGVSARAAWFLAARSQAEVVAAVRYGQANNLPLLVLGGGSNLILSGDFPGLVLQIALQGMQIDSFADGSCLIDVAAGENWHSLVARSVADGYSGLENLALIPGTVGAAPVQNIGAYGVELKDCLESLEVLDTQTLTLKRLSREDCQFSYRHSVFKTAAGQSLIILSLRLRLARNRALCVDYGDLRERMADLQLPMTAVGVMAAVVKIRQEKLPDPAEIPNVGSFFKNPLIALDQFDALQRKFPGLVHYPADHGRVKLAAGWLIDQCGWRGFLEDGVGVHERQALVLINPGHSSGARVLALAQRIRESVLARFGVALEIEPVIV